MILIAKVVYIISGLGLSASLHITGEAVNRFYKIFR